MPVKTKSPADDLVYDSHGMVAGETVGQWALDWWKWAFNTPLPGGFNSSPMMDTTGAAANTNQPASGMFFLGGTFYDYIPTPVVRTFDAPANTPLLAPLLTGSWMIQQGDYRVAPPAVVDGQKVPPTAPQGQAGQTLDFFKHFFTSVFLQIDGHDVSNLHTSLTQMGWSTVGPVQPDSIMAGADATNPYVLDKNGYTEAKAVGYFAVIKGFAADTYHTIRFGGTTADGHFVDVTDNIHFVG